MHFPSDRLTSDLGRIMQATEQEEALRVRGRADDEDVLKGGLLNRQRREKTAQRKRHTYPTFEGGLKCSRVWADLSYADESA